MSEFQDRLEYFSQLLGKFNKTHSLTNYKNFTEVIEDSLRPLRYLKHEPKIAIDIGSGAGFPGLILAMKLKETSWHLFEPNYKKSSFLTLVKVNLGLDNVKIHSDKIENVKPFKADLITSRALMKCNDLIKICDGFYDEDSYFLLYKGSSLNDELKDGVIKEYEIFTHHNRNYLLFKGI